MFHMISYVPRLFYVFLSDHATAHAHLKISSLGCASTVEFTLRSLHKRSAMAARRGHTVNSKSEGSSDRPRIDSSESSAESSAESSSDQESNKNWLFEF